MLEVENLHAYYGKSHILQGVSFNIQEGEIVSLLGRNGVGRSTTVKTIMGEVEPHGSIRYKNEEIAGKKAFEIAKLGMRTERDLRNHAEAAHVPSRRDHRFGDLFRARLGVYLGIGHEERPVFEDHERQRTHRV